MDEYYWPPRTITQLCGGSERLFALCNDGTVWQLLGGMWLPEPGIPQPKLSEQNGASHLEVNQ